MPAPGATYENNIGIAAEIPEDGGSGEGFFDDEFRPTVRRLIMRVTVCPGDYDRDGDVDEDDTDLLILHSDGDLACISGPYYPLWCHYPDWDFDGEYNAHSDGWDLTKFNGGWNLGCP